MPLTFVLSNLRDHLPRVSLADLQLLLQIGWGHLPGLQLLDKQAAIAAKERQVREERERERAEEEVPALPLTLGPLELPATFDIRQQHNLRRVAPHLLERGQPLWQQMRALLVYLTSKFRCIFGMQHTFCVVPMPTLPYLIFCASQLI